VVIHCTELPTLELAREYGERIHYPESGTGNSGHFYLDRDGRVEQWVPVERVAHHVRGHNEHSLGIELVNRGRFPNWLDSRAQDMSQTYPSEQIDALIQLLLQLAASIGSLRFIAGHQQLDVERVAASDRPELQVFRKLDPGPLFPWDRVMDSIPLERYPDQSGRDLTC